MAIEEWMNVIWGVMIVLWIVASVAIVKILGMTGNVIRYLVGTSFLMGLLTYGMATIWVGN